MLPVLMAVKLDRTIPNVFERGAPAPICRAMRHAAALLGMHSLFGASMLALSVGM